MKYFKVFNTEAEYLEYAASYNFLTPNVSTLRDCTHTWITAEQHSFSEDYFTIESLEDDNTIRMTRYITNNADMGVYSLSVSTDDGETWSSPIEVPHDGEPYEIVTLNTGDRALLKYESGVLSLDTGNYANITSDGEFNVYGNAMSLRTDDFVGDTSSKNFSGLLKGSKVVSARDLVLPSSTVGGDGYVAMFSGCTSLTTAPKLSATTLDNNSYKQMFKGCSSLTAAPILPATRVYAGTYTEMFSGCTSLTTAPELPATTLGSSCYREMFGGCTNLVTPPSVLPASAVSEHAYRSMFVRCSSLTTTPTMMASTVSNSGCCYMYLECTSLTTVPTLSATTTGYDAYRGMFADCTSLTTIPSNVIRAASLPSSCCYVMFSGCTSLATVPVDMLQSTTMGPNAYKEMFYGCTSLTNAPKLLAMSLNNYCYNSMFGGCTALTTVQSDMLPAETLVTGCYQNMFSGCTSLTTTPILSSTTLANACYNGMFNNCTSLIETPELPATTLADSCYRGMFNNCTSLTTITSNIAALTIPQNACNSMFHTCTSLQSTPQIAATTVDASGCYNMFRQCTSLTTATELHASSVGNEGFRAMFYGCGNLVTAPSVISASTIGNSGCSEMFKSCASLTTAPEISATTLGVSAFKCMFQDCTSLTTAPSQLPAMTLSESCYNTMFRNCSAMTTVQSDMLPATTLAKDCYNSMFYDCKHLTASPTLQAQTLEEGCYNSMFRSCHALNDITCYATDISASNCTTNWTYQVNDTGVFTKRSTMSDWTTGANGIPTNWTIQDDTYVAVTSVTLSTGTTTVDKGNTTTLTVTVLPSNATNTAVTWSTSDSTVATVANGVITGVGCGNANIIVTSVDNSSITAQCVVTVENHVTAVDLNTYVASVGSGGTYQLVETITPSDACDTSVTWSSSDSAIASVDATGLVSGVTTGSATITVTTHDGGFTKNCAVTVTEPQHPTAVILSDASITINANDTYTLTATVLPADAANKNVTWSSSDATIASVDSSGVVSGVATGSTIITVTTVDGGLTAQCSVTVEQVRDYSLEYFTIESLVDNNEVKIWRGQNSAPTNFDIEYSLDSGTTWVGTNSATTSVTIVNSGDTMLLRASASKWANSYSAHTSIACSGNYIVYGNIMSLLYGDSYIDKVSFTNDFTLAGVFWANMSRSGSDTGTATTNTTLISAENLILPATTLRSNCYNGMFRGCVGLEYPPKELPAPVVTTAAYSSMFDECYNLRTIPNIKATSVTDKENFRRMFRVQNTSVNPRLTEVHLPHIETLVTQSFQELFKGQKNLSYIECTVTGKTANNCLDNWVNGVAASGVFVKDANTSWNTGVNGIPNGWITNDYVADVFYMIANTNSVVSFTNTIWYGYGEKQIWTQLTANTNLNIQSGEKIIFKAALTPSSSDGIGHFDISGDVTIGGNLTSLIIGQASDTLSGYDYAFKGLFSGCTDITDASSLTMHDTLSSECYNRMFYGCTSITKAPKLPAGTLVADCYKEMFSGCTSLNHIEALFLTEPSTAYTSNWVNGVAATGTFKTDVYIQWDTETNRGVNGIPQGWTVGRSYVELEYIESTSGNSGGQYIDLDINLYETLNNWYDIAIKFTFLGNGKDNQSQATMFGCQENVSPWPGTFIRRNNNDVVGRYIGGTSKDNTIGTVGSVVPIELPVQTTSTRNVTNLNNNNTTHSWGTSLFCYFSDSNNTAARFCRAKLYYFKLFWRPDASTQGTLVRDMIPCRVADGTVGLFDRVNNKFYSSPNGVAFEAGPVVNS